MNGVAAGELGKIMGAFGFDGSDDYVLPEPDYSDFTTGLTVALWAKTEAVDFWGRFVDLGKGAGADNILFARNAGNDRVTFEVYRGGVCPLDSSRKFYRAVTL